MAVEGVIKGLTILKKYGSVFGLKATDDILRYDRTRQKISNSDLEKLVKLGWFQEIEGVKEYSLWSYDPEKPWVYYL